MSEKSPITFDTQFQRFQFNWDIFDVIIGGRSLLDTNMGLTGFTLKGAADADRFMRSYGFDLDDPIQTAESVGNLHEAIAFVRKYFLQPENPNGLKLELPRKILEINDVRELLLMASGAHSTVSSQPTYRLWACAILKVIHAIAHMDKDIRTPYFSDIQKQVFDRFYKAIHRDGSQVVQAESGKSEQLYLGDNPEDALRVDLVAFETKEKKSRESILVKLLHKPENVADEIFDRVGVRFITKTKLDVLRVVKFLKDRLIIMPSNIKPSRSRNNLIDMSRFKSEIAELESKARTEKLSMEEYAAMLERHIQSPEQNTDNKHSSEFYRSIQFTARQLVQLKNPLYEDLREMKNLIKKQTVPQDLAKMIQNIDLQYVQREVRFFYPYEVQIVDSKTHIENEQGRGAHSEYKRAQVQTALTRVMGPLATG